MLIYMNIFTPLSIYICKYIYIDIFKGGGQAPGTGSRDAGRNQVPGADLRMLCTGLIPTDALGGAGAFRAHPRLWEQRGWGEPTPLSSAPTLPGGSRCDFKPCSVVKAAKPPQKQSPAASIWGGVGTSPKPSWSTNALRI